MTVALHSLLKPLVYFVICDVCLWHFLVLITLNVCDVCIQNFLVLITCLFCCLWYVNVAVSNLNYCFMPVVCDCGIP